VRSELLPPIGEEHRQASGGDVKENGGREGGGGNKARASRTGGGANVQGTRAARRGSLD
jgi:hypothetical protein